MKKTTIFQLTSENLTGLGGPMGTERTWINWSKPYHDLVSAKEGAWRAYKKQAGKEAEKIIWSYENGCWHTQDLRFVMYTIKKMGVL